MWCDNRWCVWLYSGALLLPVAPGRWRGTYWRQMVLKASSREWPAPGSERCLDTSSSLGAMRSAEPSLQSLASPRMSWVSPFLMTPLKGFNISFSYSANSRLDRCLWYSFTQLILLFVFVFGRCCSAVNQWRSWCGRLLAGSVPHWFSQIQNPGSIYVRQAGWVHQNTALYHEDRRWEHTTLFFLIWFYSPSRLNYIAFCLKCVHQ